MSAWSFAGVMPGQLCSKSNTRKIAKVKGRLLVIKSEESRRYVADFVRLFAGQGGIYTGAVRFTVRAYYKDERRDLDVALLQDCLQHAGLIKNDRQVKEIHAYRYLDPARPRAEFTVEAL